jgi:hypothetical protein
MPGHSHAEFTMANTSRRDVLHGLAVWGGGFALTAASRSDAAAEVPLAIQGYDVVAYFTDGKPVQGLPEIAYEWDERSYRFSTAVHRDLFISDPVRYAPQFGNYCAMALANSELVVANPENWLIADDKLYIFGKSAPMGPTLFQRDLAANVVKANQNRPMLPGDQ